MSVILATILVILATILVFDGGLWRSPLNQKRARAGNLAPEQAVQVVNLKTRPINGLAIFMNRSEEAPPGQKKTFHNTMPPLSDFKHLRGRAALPHAAAERNSDKNNTNIARQTHSPQEHDHSLRCECWVVKLCSYGFKHVGEQLFI